MLDGIWYLYTENGGHLGVVETRVGNDVLLIGKEMVEIIAAGDILHMDEKYSAKAWKIEVMGNYRGRPYELRIRKLSDRPERYTPETPGIALIQRLLVKPLQRYLEPVRSILKRCLGSWGGRESS